MIRYRQYARLATHPRVNRRAHTVFPAEAGDTPNDAAVWITLPPNATPTLGRQERMPAKIAIARPILKVFDRVAADLPSERVRRDPAMEHSAIPKMTSAVPAS